MHTPKAVIIQFEFLDHVLELVSDTSNAAPIIVVVGDENSVSHAKGAQSQISVVRWEELLQTESKLDEVRTHAPGSLSLISVSLVSRHAIKTFS